jgi:hypothetical protein
MTERGQLPDKPGFYWARWLSPEPGDWQVVEASECDRLGNLRALLPGVGGSQALDRLAWRFPMLRAPARVAA